MAYKSPITTNLQGNIDFRYVGDHPNRRLPIWPYIARMGSMMMNTDIRILLVTPDSLAMGLTWKPQENLSIELGGIYTRWSLYDNLDISMDNIGGGSTTKAAPQKPRDGLGVNISVEYSPTDWLTLRAGYMYETPVINEKYADFMIPSHGRDGISLGAGLRYENFSVDLGWQHVWLHPLSYHRTRAEGIIEYGNIATAKSHLQADSVTLSLSYQF